MLRISVETTRNRHRLRAILGNRPDIRIVGDRFVFQSELFFDTGQAVLKPEGRLELDKLAAVTAEPEAATPEPEAASEDADPVPPEEKA